MELEYQKLRTTFKNKFETRWGELVQALPIQQVQFMSGVRLRPYFVFAGYLANKPDLKMNDAEYELVIDISICIELLHKSSLLLDDLIDGDNARHGKPAFHVEKGESTAIMFAVYTIGQAIKRFYSLVMEKYQNRIIMRDKGFPLMLQTVEEMSLGEIKELALNKNIQFDVTQIKNISRMETSEIIATSLLVGYYACDGENQDVGKILKQIAYSCGYSFQVMNDLEAFCQKDKLKKHKGGMKFLNCTSELKQSYTDNHCTIVATEAPKLTNTVIAEKIRPQASLNG